MGRVKSVKVSKAKKQPKIYLEEGYFKENYGLEGDIHSGSGERQVSIFAFESREKIKNENLEGLCTANFDENIETEGIDLFNQGIGTKIRIGEAEMEITQVGKKCYKECPIIKQKESCILSKECIFAKVIKSGMVRVGDEIAKLSFAV